MNIQRSTTKLLLKRLKENTKAWPSVGRRNLSQDPAWILAMMLGYGEVEKQGKSLYYFIQNQTGWSLDFLRRILACKDVNWVITLIEMDLNNVAPN
jgi:hypothetical protein